MATVEEITLLPRWIRATKYAEISGISPRAIEAKRTRGVWLEGTHWIKAPDGTIMVNWRAVDDWVESNTVH